MMFKPVTDNCKDGFCQVVIDNRPVLKIKKLNPNAKIPDYAHSTDSGMDLYYCGDVPLTIEPGNHVLVPTGISIELPPNTEAQIRSKSGLAAIQGLFVLNSPGTIDESYRGSVGVIIANFSECYRVIEPNQKIAQMVITPVIRVKTVEVTEISDSDRGSGGFGSTGLK